MNFRLRSPSVLFFLLALPGSVLLADDLMQPGQITIDPRAAPVILSFQGPAYDGLASSRGLTLSYHDAAISVGIFKLYRPSGEYQWQFTDGAGGDRLAMKLANDHSVTLYDPAGNGSAANSIVLTPGPARRCYGQWPKAGHGEPNSSADSPAVERWYFHRQHGPDCGR